MKEKTVTYTCPMHPEVTSDASGTCFTCGMNLVKQERQHEGEDGCASDEKELETQEQEPTSWWGRYLYKLGKKPSCAKGFHLRQGFGGRVGRAREDSTHGKKSHDCCH